MDTSALPTKSCKNQSFARCLQRFRLERDPYRTTLVVTRFLFFGGGVSCEGPRQFVAFHDKHRESKNFFNPNTHVIIINLLRNGVFEDAKCLTPFCSCTLKGPFTVGRSA